MASVLDGEDSVTLTARLARRSAGALVLVLALVVGPGAAHAQDPVLQKLIKQSRDSQQQFVAAGRTDLADKEAAEIAVYERYLPQALGAAELEALIAAAIAGSGAAGIKDMGKVMAALKAKVQGRADMAIITTDNPRHESPSAIARDIQGGLQRRGSARVMLDRERAIKHALAQAQADDCVLIAGKGHEQFQIIGESRYEFDDAYVARCCLYNREPDTSNYGRAQLALGNC